MRFFYYLFLSLISMCCHGLCTAQHSVGTIHISKDSLPRTFSKGMYFQDGDNPAFAARDFDDHAWQIQDTRLLQGGRHSTPFSGIAWFRIHLVADSNILGVPLSVELKQHGASALYIDGKLMQNFGEIGGKDSSSYYNPGIIPYVFELHEPGEHVLAIRYANAEALNSRQNHEEQEAGFHLTISRTNSRLGNQMDQILAWSVLLMFFFTVFLTIALLHLLLFLYNRADKANAWFSAFSLCMGMIFVVELVRRYTHTPSTGARAIWMALPLGLLACFSMSGLINTLFTRDRRRFYLIGTLCLASVGLHFFNRNISLFALVILICAVSLEAVTIIVIAMRRRLKGARIIGTGILFFSVFMLFLYVVGIAGGGSVDVGDGTFWGFITMVLLLIAILSVPASMSTYLAWSFARVSRNLSGQLAEVERLSAKAREDEAEKERMLQFRQEELEQEVAARTEDLRTQKKKSDDLLLNILPAEVAEELKETGRSDARLYNDVSVLFTDFVNFTQTAENLSPAALVAEIDDCFRMFDSIIEQHGLEKIKTVGDAYIAVCGMPAENPRHAEATVAAALAINAFMEERRAVLPNAFNIRLGIHSGPVVAGIVGVKKFAYDIWGDTVNTAARMEQHSETNAINISAVTYELVKDAFQCTYRGELEAKHKGKMGMYFVSASNDSETVTLANISSKLHLK